jgi:hypothetical protein
MQIVVTIRICTHSAIKSVRHRSGLRGRIAHPRDRLKELAMLRSVVRPALVLVMVSMAPHAFAAERGSELVAPTAAVREAWAQEARQHGPSSGALTAMYGVYGALQGLDMASTIKARNQGAREVNPIMAGGYGGATARKAVLAGATLAAVGIMQKKHRKAAFVTLLALNAATAAVAASNFRNASRISGR